MKAILLVAGYATRLYPLTENYPKALLSVGGMPLLDHILHQINKLEEVDEIHVVSNDKFYAHFLDWAQKHGDPRLHVHNDGTRGESVGWCSTVGYSISRNCEKTRMAWKFIKYLTSEEGYRVMNQLNYAVPGRQSLITEPAFADPSTNGSKLNAASAKVFFDLAKTARVNNSARYSSPKWIEEFEKKLDLYFTDTYKTVDELMQKTEKAVNAALKSSDPQLFE